MARRKKNLGSAPTNGGCDPQQAQRWFNSARSNFLQIRGRHHRADPCGLIEHYTDVATEAEAAGALVSTNSELHRNAMKLRSTAVRAQRGAVAACKLGARPKRRK